MEWGKWQPVGGPNYSGNTRGLGCPTGGEPAFENIGENRHLSNLKLSANRTGKSAMQMFAQDGHKRAARMLGFALTANDPVIWVQASAVFAHRLSSGELQMLAYCILRALEASDRQNVFSAAHWVAS